jgi:hypothetical protein
MSVSREQFDAMNEKWGDFSSWAVWKRISAGSKPTAGVGDVSVLNPDENPTLLSTLRCDVVMLGLNASSRPATGRLGNFHDPRSNAKDFKIRFAFDGTPWWGAYMTDVFKGMHETDSQKVLSYLREYPETVATQIARLRDEFTDLGSADPLLIAFGSATYTRLREHLGTRYRLVKVPHYSHRISKENYRAQTIAAIESYLGRRHE